METALSVLVGVITLMGAILWVYRERQSICKHTLRLIPRVKAVGIRRAHPNRKVAMDLLSNELQSSAVLRVMNLKGYSIVEEQDVPDTLLYRLLGVSQRTKKIDIILHFPDSVALTRRAQELGEGYTVQNMRAEHAASIRKIGVIEKMFPRTVTLRYFREPIPLWNLVIWDTGILVGWYEQKKAPGHRGWCLELKRDSILGRQFEKYFESVWSTSSVSAETYRSLVPLFPTSSTYPSDIATFESLLSKQYGRAPSQENAFVILIGGGAGTGKSTLAWQLAAILGVRNVISTDLVRQMMRHDSNAPQILFDETWESWRRVGSEKTVDTLYAGLKEQADLLSKPLLALAEYALSKGMSTIVEGIHILPNTEIASLRSNPRCVLFFVDAPEDQIDANFEMRKYSTHMRRVRDGFASLEDRIALHDRMLELARASGLSVVRQKEWSALVHEAVTIVAQHLSREEDARAQEG